METPTSSLSSSSSSFESLSSSFYSKSVCRRKVSYGYRYRSSNSSRFEESTHYFLGSCYLCKKNLGDGRDIYMYRGDTPFCSEDCRQQQIKVDETQEKSKLRSSAVKAKEKRSDQSAAISSESGTGQSRATATATRAC